MFHSFLSANIYTILIILGLFILLFTYLLNKELGKPIGPEDEDDKEE